MLRKVNLICVGNLKKPYLRYLEEKYISNINLINIKESNKNDESEEILKVLNRNSNGFYVLFDLQGKESNRFIEEIKNNYKLYKDMIFIIGGGNGVSLKLKKSCNLVLKLSDLTYSHQIFRISSILFIREILFIE